MINSILHLYSALHPMNWNTQESSINTIPSILQMEETEVEW